MSNIPYFWVAFYKDGSIFPQYDFDTGQAHLFKEIDQSKLEKFGWFPFTEDLAKKVGDPRIIVNTKLPYFVIRLKEGQRLIALRREYQHFYNYEICTNCGFTWQWMPNQPDGSIGSVGLPRYGSEKYFYSESLNGKPIFELICPKCGVKNLLKCPKCNEWWNKTQQRDVLECPKCGMRYEKTIRRFSGYKIENIFLLGWQETIENRNKKMIMFIHPDGTFELSEDFNAL